MVQTTAEGSRCYRGEPYWEMEAPEEAGSSRIHVSFYPTAGKLQVSQFIRDEKSGAVRRVRTITLDQEDLTRCPEVRDLIIAALEGWH